MKHQHHLPVMQNPRIAMLAGATAALLSLAACGLSPADRAAASVGFGDTISEKTLNNIARPPKQVVYRFDDHRYIENDPGPGYNLPCQAELFYVDEQLGIRTQVGGNSKHNPEGLFKVVDSPYVVTRSDASVRVSFDQGHTFKIIPDVPGSVDVVVVGDKIYMGSDGFTEGPIRLRVIKPDAQKIELQYTAQKPLDDPYQIHRLEAAGWPVPKPDPRYAELKKAAREYVNVRSTHQDSTQYFTCRRDLPWRPSINRERQLQKQQQQNPSTVNAS
ncbi:hypothetical protein [Ralstonia pseudosolanacearum]|uniref:T6SS immunity protein Tli3 family protein n=1 Tax=Ralstonia pseudosolanacearum TaxID=1310165 RepID=UPI000B60FDCE|nr:hypothetical protein [Ralstonia pseudosolanacearum]ASL75470.1 hypothetical protein BC350_14350 [Ralstonia pseudosolanacearum]